jgi:centromeric protein E
MATAENVSVSIRVRPLNARESGVEQAWRVNQAAGSLTQANLPAKMTPATYTFDHVFDQSATSAQVYTEVAKNVVISAMGGINGTVFCYGQTGSGKTHTMHGNAECPGIVPAAIHDIFAFIQKNPERAFMLRCSYWEIYNEAIKDLLQPSNEDLQIREAVGRGIFVADCKEEIVVSAKTMLNLVALGNTHRHTSETRMNEASSRSHSIFRITIESHLREKSGETTDGAIRVASLNLVDLAGSERQSSTGAEGAKLKEGSQINKSLLILGNVISKLSEGKAGQHIPYRDSKLTRILEPALGGNSRTAILCTVTTAGL